MSSIYTGITDNILWIIFAIFSAQPVEFRILDFRDQLRSNVGHFETIEPHVVLLFRTKPLHEILLFEAIGSHNILTTTTGNGNSF